MTGNGYIPLYPQDTSLPDQEIQKFISRFYEISDKPELNDLWVNCFTKDADVAVAADGGKGEKGACRFPNREL
jgi:hypothetical protein